MTIAGKAVVGYNGFDGARLYALGISKAVF